MKGVCRMSAKKLRTITSVICFLMIFAYVIYLQAVWATFRREYRSILTFMGYRTGMERGAFIF